MDWPARDGLRADQHERYVQPLYEPWGYAAWRADPRTGHGQAVMIYRHQGYA